MSDSITIIDENKVIDVVLIAGRILLEAGAEKIGRASCRERV